jgi:uncharacterized protein (DUF427 family)
MVKAIWNGAVLAESDQTIVVERNHYFPPSSIKDQYFEDSETHTVCSWKGIASYYNLNVDGATNKNAAWYYSAPQPAAEQITGYVAFWRGVEVREA